MQYFQVMELYGNKWVVIVSSLSPCAAKKQFTEEIRLRRIANQTFNRLMWVRSKVPGEIFSPEEGIMLPRTYTPQELETSKQVEFSWR